MIRLLIILFLHLAYSCFSTMASGWNPAIIRHPVYKYVEEGVHIYSFNFDSNNHLYLYTTNGVYVYNGLMIKRYSDKDGLSDNNVFQGILDYEGRMWLGTYSGQLCFIKNDSLFTAFNTPYLNIPSRYTEGGFVINMSIESDSSITIVHVAHNYFINIRKDQVTFTPLYLKVKDNTEMVYGMKKTENNFKFFTNYYYYPSIHISDTSKAIQRKTQPVFNLKKHESRYNYFATNNQIFIDSQVIFSLDKNLRLKNNTFLVANNDKNLVSISYDSTLIYENNNAYNTEPLNCINYNPNDILLINSYNKGLYYLDTKILQSKVSDVKDEILSKILNLCLKYNIKSIMNYSSNNEILIRSLNNFQAFINNNPKALSYQNTSYKMLLTDATTSLIDKYYIFKYNKQNELDTLTGWRGNLIKTIFPFDASVNRFLINTISKKYEFNESNDHFVKDLGKNDNILLHYSYNDKSVTYYDNGLITLYKDDKTIKKLKLEEDLKDIIHLSQNAFLIVGGEKKYNINLKNEKSEFEILNINIPEYSKSFILNDTLYLINNDDIYAISIRHLEQNQSDDHPSIDVTQVDKFLLKISFKSFGFIGYKTMYSLDKKKWNIIPNEDNNLRINHIKYEEDSIHFRIYDWNDKLIISKSFPLINHASIWTSTLFKIALMATAIIISTFLIYYLISKMMRKRIKKEKEKYDNRLLQFRRLNALMNPHFIFNSLNNTQLLINSGSKQDGSNLITKLARIIRYNMNHINKDLVTLREEIELTKMYVDIEMEKLLGSFDFDIEVENGILLDQIMIPPLIIQPLVENSIQHAMVDTEMRKKIQIKIFKEFENIIITIADNGSGLESHTHNIKNNGIAQQNIIDRFAELYKNSGIKIDFESGFILLDETKKGYANKITIYPTVNKKK